MSVSLFALTGHEHEAVVPATALPVAGAVPGAVVPPGPAGDVPEVDDDAEPPALVVGVASGVPEHAARAVRPRTPAAISVAARCRR